MPSPFRLDALQTRWIARIVFVAIALSIAIVVVDVSLLSGEWTHYIQDEDGLIEMLSAVAFLLAGLAGLRATLTARTSPARVVGLLICLTGFVGFLDEISFGQRIYWFEPYEPYGIPIDAVHDLFTLAYAFLSAHFTGMQVASIGLAAAAAAVFVLLRFRRTLSSLRSEPGLTYLVCAIALIFVAATIDLEFLNVPLGHFIYSLEETFELDAGIVLLGGALVQMVELRRRVG